MKIPTIGIAIPCFKGHIKYLNRLFDSIQSQTVTPQMVVVSCSSSTEDDLKQEFNDCEYSFPFKIIIIPEYRNAAQNRNEAARALDTDIISFFDADDIMHPQRTECIRQCFTMVTQSKIMLHAFTVKGDFILYNGFEFRNGIIKKCNSDWLQIYNIQNPETINSSENITNGHSSIRKEVFKEIQFNEDNSLRDRDDSIFCTNVIEKYPYQNTYCPLILSKYVPSCTMII